MPAASMLTVSLPIEILRTRPRLIFWLAVLAQASLWVIVPTLFYSAPPGELAEVLAVGHTFAFGSELGPPLAPWLAEIALRAAGGHMIGVYLLAQICIVATYWAVFQLGRETIGDRHAVLAVLLMVGISVFTISSPDFGPDILMMPLWAFAILHLWRATGQDKQLYWFALAVDFWLMLLTSHLALLLFAVVVAFVLINPRARKSALNPAVGMAAITVACMMLPNVVLIRDYGFGFTPNLARLRNVEAIDQNIIAWARLLMLVAVAHAGAGILLVLASNLARTKKDEAAIVPGQPVEPFARIFVYCLALAPLIVVTAFAVISGKSDLSGIPPLLVLSGLAIVTAAGETIMLHHQRILTIAWISLLIVPAVLMAAGALLLPALFAVDLKVAQPADDIAKFFTENFERRTQRKLDVVAGDPRLASIVSVASSSRPNIYHDPKSGRPQLARREEALEKGTVVLWRATDSAGTPPPEVKAQFPDIVPEVPRAFDRAIPGRAPVLRIGWGVVRPQTATPALLSPQPQTAK
jgi:4-amino-4-deoxy-L-arabinose transferase-like glycosyltransferase